VIIRCQTNEMMNSSLFADEDTDTQLQWISMVNSKQKTPIDSFRAVGIHMINIVMKFFLNDNRYLLYRKQVRQKMRV